MSWTIGLRPSDAVELANIEGAQGGGGSYGKNNNDDDDNGVGDGGVEMPGSGNGGGMEI